jgi:hypothetical protein
MATQSPYFGTYQQNRLPVVRLAPDGFITLNGDTHVTSCHGCGKRIDLNGLVTSMSVDLNIDGAPGSASISLTVPRHLQDDLFQDGQLILTTMMEVEIYYKGFFLVDGQVKYYRNFWGLVTSVSEEYSGGEHTVNLQCSDILHWWNVQQINMNPSFVGAKKSSMGLSILGGAFRNTHPYDIIWNLARFAYGDTLDANLYLRTMKQEPREVAGANQTIQAQTALYWQKRWGRIASAIRMYGMNAQVFTAESVMSLAESMREEHKVKKKGRGSVAAEETVVMKPFTTYLKNVLDSGLGEDLTKKTEGGIFDVDAIKPFTLDYTNLANFDLWQSEFQSKLEIATLVKETIGFEFFMDVTGEIIFKPPFWNLDVKKNKPVSWIRDMDIISWSFSEGEPEATFLEGEAAFQPNISIGTGSVEAPHAQYADYRLIAKYGWRNPGSVDISYTNSSKKMFLHLIDRMDQINLAMNSATITIPMRPELRLGYPVYVEPKDSYWYIKGLQHDLNFGGQATTTLVLEGRRSKFNAPEDLQVPESAPVVRRDETGKIVGVKNVVMRFQQLSKRDESLRESEIDQTKLIKAEAEQVSATRSLEEQAEVAVPNLLPSEADLVIQGNLTGRSLFGVGADGRYIYQTPESGDGIPTKDQGNYSVENVKEVTILNMEGDKGKTVKAPVFPVSDAQGYEVLGSYAYGRDLSVSTRPGVFVEEWDSDESVAEAITDVGASSEGPAEGTDGELNEKMQEKGGTATEASTNDASFVLDPNNYAANITDLQPSDASNDCDCTLAKSKQFLEFFGTDGNPIPLEIAGTGGGIGTEAADIVIPELASEPDPPVDEAALYQELLSAYGPGEFGPDEDALVQEQVAAAVAAQAEQVAVYEASVAARDAALEEQQALDEANGLVRSKKEVFNQLNDKLSELYESNVNAHGLHEKELRGEASLTGQEE